MAEVRVALCVYVQGHLRDLRSVGIVDETAFLKKGIPFGRVAQQYSSTTERVENCQVVIFLAYTGARGIRCWTRNSICLKGGPALPLPPAAGHYAMKCH